MTGGAPRGAWRSVERCESNAVGQPAAAWGGAGKEIAARSRLIILDLLCSVETCNSSIQYYYPVPKL